jgi:transcriptional regulator with XRE-family HTH domain
VIHVASPIGAFVRELRQARQMSMNQLAERAAVAKSTLSRWEAGAFQPRLPELEAVLTALQVSPVQRARAMAQVQAPRAVGRLRHELASAATADDETGLIPAGGDLLRAMRRRRGLAQEQVAASLRVSSATISYWEQSKVVPPSDRLAALFEVLGAQPEERAFLTEGRCFLAPPLQETPATLDALEQTLATLRGEVYAGKSSGIDLRFLVLESQLAPLAPPGRAARLLLTRVLAQHAEWLSWGRRRQEALRCADRVVEILRQDDFPLYTARALPLTVHVQALIIGNGSRRDSAAQAVELLQSWFSGDPPPQWQTFLYREMANHATDAGVADAALDFSRRARSAAERTADARDIRTSQNVQARVLARLGRHREALDLMPVGEDKVPLNGFFEAVRRAEALLGLEEWNDARRWVNRAYDLAAICGLSHLRAQVETLARQL